jgi:hypothetical protein
MKMNREFVILFVGRVSQAVIALVAIRILTDLLDKENIGKTYLVTTITAYFSMIFINPVSMYMNRRLHLWFQEKKLFSALRYLNWYLLAIACLSIPVVLGSYFYLNVGTGFLPWQICFLVFFNIYTGNWFLNLGSSLNMLERRGAFVFFNLTTQVLGLLASLACIFYFEMNAFF